MTDKITKDELYQIVTEGIWYYNRLGEVSHISFPSVDDFYIKCKQFSKQFCFRWEHINKRFFLSEEDAEKNAKEYLEDVLKYVSLDTLKKIIHLEVGEEFWHLHKGLNCICEITNEQWSHWDKYKRAYISVTEYDDDFCGGTVEEEFPISEYGKTWALTKEELISGKENI